jgi:hypothetical protein
MDWRAQGSAFSRMPMRSEIVPLAMLHAKAREVRLAFECNAFDTELARRAYRAYAPDIDLDLFLDRARGLFPALNCGLCSTYLAAVLGCGVIRRGKYGDMGHTVLMVGGLIVDITADQFGGAPMYVGAPQLPWRFDEEQSLQSALPRL